MLSAQLLFGSSPSRPLQVLVQMVFFLLALSVAFGPKGQETSLEFDCFMNK